MRRTKEEETGVGGGGEEEGRGGEEKEEGRGGEAEDNEEETFTQ